MDEGWVLLVNLAAADRISEDNARLLGTLIVSDLFLKAKGRPEGSRPFYLYIDECGRYINEDIQRILDEGRKFGLHLVLAHQHLAQLGQPDEVVYNAVMTDARTKVIFGGLNVEDARTLAEQVFLGELNLEEPKSILDKPVVVGYETMSLQSRSQSRGGSESYSESKSQAGSNSWAKGNSVMLDQEGEEKGSSRSKSEGTTQSSIQTEGYSQSKSWQESEGVQEALKPILKKLPTQVYGLEEQLYKAVVLMVNQPARHAILKLPKGETQIIAIPVVKEGYVRQARVKQFKEQAYSLAAFAQPRALIEAQIEERQRLLLEQALRPESPVQEPLTFRE